MNGTSPIRRRPALIHKSVNSRHHVHKSPKLKSPEKRAIEVEKAIQRSPVRKVGELREPGGCLPQLEGGAGAHSARFTFYEETQEQRESILIAQDSLARQTIQDENDFEQIKENVGSGLGSGTHRDGKRCFPLNDLDISEYRGTIKYSDSQEEYPLTLPLNGAIRLPTFVTPPRNQSLRQFFDIRPERPNNVRNGSRTTDDINENKVIRKLAFKIMED
ncbi:LAMI_0B08416g1_1 [Lachancea mirantina]|uniref:LAMI_0B08416g1_1 n=1 Tax=Lachancea mirantina TaxID=1230905 RepID=A0A1G4IYE7_9SACH|nr:LAMI_0B08416g1_1 [Lachancea mirantina]